MQRKTPRLSTLLQNITELNEAFLSVQPNLITKSNKNLIVCSVKIPAIALKDFNKWLKWWFFTEKFLIFFFNIRPVIKVLLHQKIADKNQI